MKFTNKKISLNNTFWLVLTVFAILILAFLWIFQILFLDTFYKGIKTRSLKSAMTIVQKTYNTTLFETITEKLQNNEGICIEIVQNNRIIYSTLNLNKSCLYGIGNTNFFETKTEFANSEAKKVILEIDSAKLEHKYLVGGIKLENNTYAYLNTTIEPIDATVEILKSQLIIVTVVVLILALVISLILSKKLSKPIKELNTSAKKIANRDYNVNFDDQSNIIEINELANTLNLAKDELKKTDELRNELMANVSHDLKTPLTMIKAYAEMIRDITYKNKEKRDSNLNVIIEEVDRLNLLVSDILALSNLQSNIQSLNIEEFNLIELINSIIKRYEIFAITESYNFEIIHSSDSIIIKADKQKLEQVLYNLISNAINYTGNDNKVTIKVIEQKNLYRIEIIDTGKGIKDEDINHIWDKYYKSDKLHKRNMIGTGLGLSIVKNILILHNYKYGVKSIREKGTTFYFEIPKK